MNFIWKMTQAQWENYMHDNNIANGYNISDCYDFYGQMFCGDFCVEFIGQIAPYLDSDSPNFICITNIYQLYVDDGYASNINGIPYTYTDFYINVPMCKTFEEFKTICEEEFAKLVENKRLEKFANKNCEW